MFLESLKNVSVSSCNKRSCNLRVFASGLLKGAVLLGMVCYQGAICAKTTFCEDIPSNIVVADDRPYECDVFDVSDVRVEAAGASFISAKVLSQAYAGSGYIRLGSGFSVAEDASFSASFVPNAKQFNCAFSCHDW